LIKNPSFLKKLEDDFSRDEGKLSFKQSLKLFTSMWNEAVELGVLPSGDPLEGIDVDIKIAKALNSCLKSSCPK